MKAQLTLDRVMVKRIIAQKAGILELPDHLKNKQNNTFEVVAVGPGRVTDAGKTIKAPVNIGDTIMVDTLGPEVEIDGEKYNIINATNVLVIL